MSDIYRLAIDVPTPVIVTIDRIAAERGVTRTGIVRHALSILCAMDAGTKDGQHAGLVRDKRTLDTLLVAPL